jgi:hypothetical protein
MITLTERIKGIADRYGGTVSRDSNDWIVVTMNDGRQFSVAGAEEGEDVIFFYGSWHKHLDTESLDGYVDALLAGRARIMITYYGRRPYSWRSAICTFLVEEESRIYLR